MRRAAMLRDWLWRSARFRGTFLLALGVMQVIYGLGIIIAARSARRVHWWPGSVHTVGGIGIAWLGWAWVAVGVFLLATFWHKPDHFQFAAAVALNTAWAIFAFQQWLLTREPGAWAPAAIYAGIAIGVTLISAWPEPPGPLADDVPPPPDDPP